MSLPRIAVYIDSSPENPFRVRVCLPIAKHRPQRELRLRIPAAAQIDRPLQSLLCLIAAAKLQVSQTNLVISLVVIWESIRSLLEMVQTSLGILLLQTFHALIEFMTRFSRHL